MCYGDYKNAHIFHRIAVAANEMSKSGLFSFEMQPLIWFENAMR